MPRTKDNLFKPEKLSATAKAAQTTSAAKDIIAGEETSRIKKTERLRALRLAAEEAAGPAVEPERKARKRK